MSRSADPGHFFQTDASESNRARKAAKSGNKNGNPIPLQSKILNVIGDPFGDPASCVWIAESAGCVRKINVETRNTQAVYRGPTAPLTSVEIGGQCGNTVFAGCWDKDIWSWDKESKVPGRRYKGHSDFVKVVLCATIGGKDCLISGGADAKIIVWDTATGERLHTLRDKTDTMMAIQDLALDLEESTGKEVTLVSSSSDPHIRRWCISLESASQILEINNTSDCGRTNTPARATILEHETSVYRIFFAGDDHPYDLWTGSADGTAKCLSREKNWAADETYKHGDYVRAVVVTSDWVVTTGRDEDVKVWDKSTGKLWHVYEGHYEEVTGLVVLDGENKVVSVSIDGTVRIWGLTKEDLAKAIKDKEEKANGVVKEERIQLKRSLLTAEEEAELAELMDSDEE